MVQKTKGQKKQVGKVGGNKQKQPSDNKTGIGQQKASANRSGTTDMDSESTTGTRTTGSKGVGATTKRNVTGSDYDGQVG
ncbi:MAG: hypothetical protein ABR502_01280 [Chitinophagaceae bacterium]